MSSSQPQSVDATVHALSTDVTLLHIFQYLGVKDLLSCRLVNQKWTAIASSVLKSRSTFIARDKYQLYTMAASEHDAFDETLRVNLEFLSNRLQTNPHFPFLGFTVSGFSNWGRHQALRDFARSSGHYFKRLIVDLICLDSLITVLGQWFNNIEELIIGDLVTFDFPVDMDQPEERIRAMLSLKNRGISLPNLRRLDVPNFDYCYDDDEELEVQVKQIELAHKQIQNLCESVLEVAPKLTCIENFHPSLTDDVIKHGKVAAISNLVIREEEYEDHMEEMQRLCESGLKLTSLELDYVGDPPGPAIANIFESSRDSLQRLKTSYFCTALPTMKKLKAVWMRGFPYREDARDGGLFSSVPVVPVSTYLPALETVRLDLLGSNGSLKGYFSSEDVFPTVKTVEILSWYSKERFRELVELFPNMGSIRVDFKKCFLFPGHRSTGNEIQDLWTFPLVIKELEIYNYPMPTDLDSILTGFPKETCDKLRRMPKLPLDPAMLDAFRVKPSVVQMKGLEKLTIFFTVGQRHEPPSVDPPPQPISDWYALGIMPNLRTCFQYDLHGEHAPILAKALEPYSGFVSVEHRWTDEVKQLFK